MIFDTIDQIYCIVYNPYKEERYDGLCKEFERVGIFNKVGNSSTRKPKVKFMYVDKVENLTGVESVVQNYQHVFADALSHNYDRIMIIEDDCRFLKNLSILNEFKDIPADADIVYLDWHVHPTHEMMHKIMNCNDLYYKLSLHDIVYLLTCTIYSRKMMLHTMLNYEYIKLPIDHYFIYNKDFVDQECFKSLNRYITCVQLCIQKEFEQAATPHHKTYYPQYQLQGVNLDDYAV